MEFLSEYGLFLAKAVTWVIAIAIIVGLIAGATMKPKGEAKGSIEVENINDKYIDLEENLQASVLSEAEFKQWLKDLKNKEKEEQKQQKAALKQGSVSHKPRAFILDFDGDMRASDTDNLREEITTALMIAESNDEFVVRLESGGGLVHSYGLAASQLDRIKQAGIPLTVCIDKVAASGGYMMACVADKIIAAPFSVLGSIGVVAQVPNIHRLLKHNKVDVELHTAGEHKRTLTMLGENTSKARKKFQEDLEDTHVLFKDFVASHRPAVDIHEIATGDVWYGTQALEHKLVDKIQTSDDYISSLVKDYDVFEVHYKEKKTLLDKLGLTAEASLSRAFDKVLERLTLERFF
ncbi:MAG: protease SohB [Cellvibrionaceae bacterium]